MIDRAHSGAVVTAASLASLVEFVEALTIALAVGTVRGWRPSLFGAVAGVLLLVVLVTIFASSAQRRTAQRLLGCTLMAMFGGVWMKAETCQFRFQLIPRI